MGMSDDVLKAVGKALENANPATKANLIKKLKSEIIVSKGWGAYFNLRVTADADGLTDAEVTHLKFTPLKNEGLVVIEVANADDEGAVEFKRSETLRTGNVQMHTALADFDLSFADERNMVFPVEVATVPVSGGERRVMIMRVKKRSTKKSIPRPRKNSPGGTAGTSGTSGTSARGNRTTTNPSASAAGPAAGPAATPAGTPSAPVAASAQTDEKKE